MHGALDGENEKVGKRGSVACGLQAPRCAHAEQFPHDQSQIARGNLEQVSFGDFDDAVQPTSSGAAGLTHMRETAFDSFAALTLQLLAPLAAHTPMVAGDCRTLLFCVLLPVPRCATFLFRNVSSH